jgi:hypothetical protein
MNALKMLDFYGFLWNLPLSAISPHLAPLFKHSGQSSTIFSIKSIILHRFWSGGFLGEI